MKQLIRELYSAKIAVLAYLFLAFAGFVLVELRDVLSGGLWAATLVTFGGCIVACLFGLLGITTEDR